MLEDLDFEVIVSFDDAAVGQDGAMTKVPVEPIVGLIDAAGINITGSRNFLIGNNFPRFIITLGIIPRTFRLDQYLFVFIKIWYNIEQMYCIIQNGLSVQWRLQVQPLPDFLLFKCNLMKFLQFLRVNSSMFKL